MEVNIKDLTDSRDAVNKLLERFGVRFGVYKKGVFNEQLFPFDSVPRIISKQDWDYLERGLKQRVEALNLFLWDIYHEKKIMKDGIIPEEFVYSSKGYMPICEGINPAGKVYSHISGIDLVEGKDGRWYVLEDNLRIPSGASYPMMARKITRKVSPNTFATNAVADNRDYADLIRDMMDDMNEHRGISVILTPGRYNSAFFEHSYFAEKTGATLAYPGDLFVEDDKVYYGGMYKEKIRVGCIYRRISDEYMDPLTFEPSSLLGVPSWQVSTCRATSCRTCACSAPAMKTCRRLASLACLMSPHESRYPSTPHSSTTTGKSGAQRLSQFMPDRLHISNTKPSHRPPTPSSVL